MYLEIKTPFLFVLRLTARPSLLYENNGMWLSGSGFMICVDLGTLCSIVPSHARDQAVLHNFTHFLLCST